MDAKELWQLFLETGAPEAYLWYHRARQMEEKNVFDDPGPGPAGHGLQ